MVQNRHYTIKEDIIINNIKIISKILKKNNWGGRRLITFLDYMITF